mmetsp:Transcript_6591/g.15746  ORF Transcript_6591/g.15746 Transcript_6591/m.15746 type:complete len:209 (-) Transcript_6591:164-790(-)
MMPLPPLALSQQVHPFLGWHHQCSAHSDRQSNGRFHGHADVVPSSTIRFKGEVSSFGSLPVVGFEKRRNVVGIRMDVLPVDHLLGGFERGSPVGLAIQRSQFRQGTGLVVATATDLERHSFRSRFVSWLPAEVFHRTAKRRPRRFPLARVALAADVVRVVAAVANGQLHHVHRKTEDKSNAEDGDEPIVQGRAGDLPLSSTAIRILLW